MSSTKVGLAAQYVNVYLLAVVALALAIIFNNDSSGLAWLAFGLALPILLLDLAILLIGTRRWEIASAKRVLFVSIYLVITRTVVGLIVLFSQDSNYKYLLAALLVVAVTSFIIFRATGRTHKE